MRPVVETDPRRVHEHNRSSGPVYGRYAMTQLRWSLLMFTARVHRPRPPRGRNLYESYGNIYHRSVASWVFVEYRPATLPARPPSRLVRSRLYCNPHYRCRSLTHSTTAAPPNAFRWITSYSYFSCAACAFFL